MTFSYLQYYCLSCGHLYTKNNNFVVKRYCCFYNFPCETCSNTKRDKHHFKKMTNYDIKLGSRDLSHEGWEGVHPNDNICLKHLIVRERIVAALRIMRIYKIIKHKRRVKAANIIKQQWIKSYYDPKHKICRNRLLRQFHELY